MGLILCKTKESKTPYVIKNMGQSICSLEELCYYIYNNVYLIGSDLICDELIEYIVKELGEEKLASNLRTLIERRAGLSDMVVCILRYVDYYSVSEIEALKDIIDSMASKNVLERLAARADNLLKNRCYHSALKNYGMVLKSKHDDSLTDIFYANVYHNMGVTYAKLFLYEPAFASFMEAYDLSKNEESRKQALVAATLYMEQNGNELMKMSAEDKFVINHEIETLMNNAVFSEGYEPVKNAFALNESGYVKEYNEALEKIIEGFEEDYMEFIN